MANKNSLVHGSNGVSFNKGSKRFGKTSDPFARALSDMFFCFVRMVDAAPTGLEKTKAQRVILRFWRASLSEVSKRVGVDS